MEEEKITTQNEISDDVVLDIQLRPQSLDDYIGQNKIKESLSVFIEAAKQRDEPLEHVLLSGPPGLGKTTLAHIIAKERGVNIRVTSGPAIERIGDLAAILTNLSNGDILFIDEIHRLNKVIAESLYPAMEDYALDIVLGKGPSARTIRLDLPKFTLIGATTRVSMLAAPMRDRFGNLYHLDFYNQDDIRRIIIRSASILDIEIGDHEASKISSRARFTPRIANRLLKRVRDFAQVKNNSIVTEDIVHDTLNSLGVDEMGLDIIDRKILEIIIDKFNGGPVGLNTIAASLSEEMETIEDVYEPYLLRIGFLNRTNRGRTATPAAYKHLGFDDINNKLL